MATYCQFFAYEIPDCSVYSLIFLFFCLKHNRTPSVIMNSDMDDVKRVICAYESKLNGVDARLAGNFWSILHGSARVVTCM